MIRPCVLAGYFCATTHTYQQALVADERDRLDGRGVDRDFVLQPCGKSCTMLIACETAYGIDNHKRKRSLLSVLQISKPFAIPVASRGSGWPIRASCAKTLSDSARQALLPTRLGERIDGERAQDIMVSLRKVAAPKQGSTYAQVLQILKVGFGFPNDTPRMESMIETTQSIINHKGENTVLLLVAAAPSFRNLRFHGVAQHHACRSESCAPGMQFRSPLHVGQPGGNRPQDQRRWPAERSPSKSFPQRETLWANCARVRSPRLSSTIESRSNRRSGMRKGMSHD